MGQFNKISVSITVLLIICIQITRPKYRWASCMYNCNLNDIAGIEEPKHVQLLDQFTISLVSVQRNRPKILKCTKDTLWVVYLLILQAGDVQVHSGPPKYPCGICDKNVGWNAKAIQCDGCNVWYHSKCANIGPRTYSLLSRSSLNLSWVCIQCGIPNTSSHHSADITDYSTDNKYSTLSNTNTSDDSEQVSATPLSSTPRKTNHPKPELDIPPIRPSSLSRVNSTAKSGDYQNNSSHNNNEITDPESLLVSNNTPSATEVSSSSLQSNISSKSCVANNLTCLVINFQSMRNKKTELYNIISCTEPDIIIGNETHLDPNVVDSEILPYGIPSEHKYKIYRKDRKALIDKGEGGVAILVKPGYDCEECPDLDSTCELKWVKITTHKKDNILIGSFYREPKSSLQALEQLELSISKIVQSNKYKNNKIFIGGDFNLGDINWNSCCTTQGARDKQHCDKLISILNCFGLEQVNTLPTRQERTLDLFITSHVTLIEKIYTCPPNRYE